VEAAVQVDTDMAALPALRSERAHQSDLNALILALVELGDAMVKHRTAFIVTFLEFCRGYAQAYALARKRGNEAVRSLDKRVGVEKSFASRARVVATHYDLLRAHELMLPDSREAIVELAKQESKEPGTIERLVQSGAVHKRTTVREVRNRSWNAAAVAEVEVRLYSTDREALAAVTAHVLVHTPDVRARVVDNGLRDAIKGAVGVDRLGEIEARLSK
jgi:hypothetical protein